MLNRTAFVLAMAWLGLTSPPAAHAVQPPVAEAKPAAPPAAKPAPSWRFRQDDRPVKVVVLAGSIGAYQRGPYAERIAKMCRNVEVRNISKTGLGAWALKKHFEQEVIKNRALRWNEEGQQYWLVFGGGLNSVGNPRATNHHMRRLFEMAHRRGINVVALSLSPWGDDGDKRWQGINGLKAKRNTQAVVDFIMGRLAPSQALGRYAAQRKQGADAPWDPTEMPDIAIDLYDSALRDRQAPLRDPEALRKALLADRSWQRAHRDLDERQRQTKLDAEVQVATGLAQWYLREELRSFDHIHPNTEGHRLMAEIICPSLPDSWGCSCPVAAPSTPGR